MKLMGFWSLIFCKDIFCPGKQKVLIKYPLMEEAALIVFKMKQRFKISAATHKNV